MTFQSVPVSLLVLALPAFTPKEKLMQNIIRSLVLLVLTAGLSPSVAAQDVATAPAPPQSALRILVGAQQVKFSAPPQTQELRLAITNQSGETVFDSGTLALFEFDWDLRDGNSVALPPGLYAYTLSLKLPDAETPRPHSGHLIIEKGQNQLWLTTRGDGPAGAEVGAEVTR